MVQVQNTSASWEMNLGTPHDLVAYSPEVTLAAAPPNTASPPKIIVYAMCS